MDRADREKWARHMSQVNKTQETSTNETGDFSKKKLMRAHMLPRWTALIGILATGVIYLFLPEKLIIGPSWLLLAIEGVLIAPFAVAWLAGYHLPHFTIRLLALVLLGVVTIVLAIGLALLIQTLPENNHAINLLQSAGLLWGLNVLVFALWYFEIDGGGPLKRHLAGYKPVDFVFPQQQDQPFNTDEHWCPLFFDYLFLAFTGATALSPADTFPLTRRAKMLMMVEALLSMTIIILLAARAVNIL
jgi:uncharacterized membrane protein